MDWIVCSPLEVAATRTAVGTDMALVVPGIRRPARSSDQSVSWLRASDRGQRDYWSWATVTRVDPRQAASIFADIESAGGEP
jgi:orotidine-5'-phosphate decarboxylase